MSLFQFALLLAVIYGLFFACKPKKSSHRNTVVQDQRTEDEKAIDDYIIIDEFFDDEH